MCAEEVSGLNGNDWAAVLDDMKENLPEPGEMDISDFMEELKLGRQGARDKVEKFVREGRLEKVWRKRPGKRSGWFYRPVKGE